ncbi:myb family transcription factor [Ophiostoma piceae UAMH 11346]|uniref:Myb family transcription factor n=1 Tax=Ophiostoma piceae (strain UAMH 11346) TaxID=1262450 RepID=S3D522_OPHP1|nr:myb family transcription factor [Ophiostoma piceae UAMH 11346]
MPRLSRTSSASSQSYTTLPSSLETSHNGSMSYYPSHHNGHHSRMASLSSNGAGASGSVAYYNHIPDDMSSPAALGDGNGSSSMTAVVANQVVANQVAYQHQHQHHDSLAMPRTSSGAWSPQDDDTLIQARARGENWAQIQTLFHGKTPNACRKRHERLMERRNANDFDTRKMEHIAREYMNMRREIWQPLAQKTGEKWTVVEQKCMASGLKNLQGVARAAGRRHRLESAYAVVGGGHYGDNDLGHHDHDNGQDVGIDDELDVDVDVDLLDGTGMSASVGSPSSSSPNGGASHGIGGGNRSVSGGSNSSGASSSMHPSVSSRRQHHGHSHSQSSYSYSHPHAHAQPHHHQHTLSGGSGEVGSSPGYPEYYTTTGFSQSLRAVDAAPAAAMTSPYANHQHSHAQSHQPRMANGDMGIDALLRR